MKEVLILLNNKLGINDARELAPEEEHLTKKRIRYIGEKEVDLITNPANMNGIASLMNQNF